MSMVKIDPSWGEIVATLALVQRFTLKIELDVFIGNEWVMGASVVETEFIFAVLTWEWGFPCYVSLVVVKPHVHDWAENLREKILTGEPGGVLNNNNCKLECLVHGEADKPVVVVELSFSEVDGGLENDWIQVTLLIKFEVAGEIDIQVLNDDLDWAFRWDQKGSSFLISVDFPMLESWEIKLKETLSFPAWLKVNFDRGHFKIDVFIFNVAPGDIPLESWDLEEFGGI